MRILICNLLAGVGIVNISVYFLQYIQNSDVNIKTISSPVIDGVAL